MSETFCTAHSRTKTYQYHAGRYGHFCPVCIHAEGHVSDYTASTPGYDNPVLDAFNAANLLTSSDTSSYDPPSIPDSTPDTSSFDFGGGGGFSGGGGGSDF